MQELMQAGGTASVSSRKTVTQVTVGEVGRKWKKGEEGAPTETPEKVGGGSLRNAPSTVVVHVQELMQAGGTASVSFRKEYHRSHLERSAENGKRVRRVPQQKPLTRWGGQPQKRPQHL
jgi:hypothetical protein